VSKRNYTDTALEAFVNDLDDNERAGLQFGILPAKPFGNLEPPLNEADVAYMIRHAEMLDRANSFNLVTDKTCTTDEMRERLDLNDT
jgi:hypothetical protein